MTGLYDAFVHKKHISIAVFLMESMAMDRHCDKQYGTVRTQIRCAFFVLQIMIKLKAISFKANVKRVLLFPRING